MSKRKLDTEPSWLPENAIRLRQMKVADKRDIVRFLRNIAIIVCILLVLLFLIFGAHTAMNNDMHPRISAGDLVIYFRLDNTLVAPNVVVYKAGGKTRVGRIVAKDGDNVEIKGSRVYVNGYMQNESDIYYDTPPLEHIGYPSVLGQDEYFILADARGNAKDSRTYGAITKDQILGNVIFVFRRDNF